MEEKHAIMSTVKHIKEAGALYFEDIMQGFDNYDSQVMKLNREEAYKLVKNLWDINGTENSYADFYYYRLEETSKKKVEAALDKEEIRYLHGLSMADDIIFYLDKTLLGILLKLNETEILFSTFYFTKEPCTLWGNYNQEYVIFHNKQNKGYPRFRVVPKEE